MTILHNGEIPVDGEVTLTHDVEGVPGHDWQHAYFLTCANDETASYDIEFRIRPHDSEQFHALPDGSIEKNNIDLQAGVVYHPNISGAFEVELTLTNTDNTSHDIEIVTTSYRE